MLAINTGGVREGKSAEYWLVQITAQLKVAEPLNVGDPKRDRNFLENDFSGLIDIYFVAGFNIIQKGSISSFVA